MGQALLLKESQLASWYATHVDHAAFVLPLDLIEANPEGKVREVHPFVFEEGGYTEVAWNTQQSVGLECTKCGDRTYVQEWVATFPLIDALLAGIRAALRDLNLFDELVDRAQKRKEERNEVS